MYRNPRIAGSWPALVTRLESGVLRGWACREEALTDLVTAGQVVQVVSRAAGSHPETAQRSDAVLAALVRLAATDGGDDLDAVLLLLHLLSPGVLTMAARFADRNEDSVAVIVAELTAQIRSFPWRRRHRAVAANLLRDTRAALMREWLPRWTQGSRSGEDLLFDHLEPFGPIQAMEQGKTYPGPGQQEDLDLGDLLEWAARTGTARRQDLQLLVDLEVRRDRDRSPRLAIAAEQQISEKTVRRRRNRALRALRQIRRDYLAAVA